MFLHLSKAPSSCSGWSHRLGLQLVGKGTLSPPQCPQAMQASVPTHPPSFSSSARGHWPPRPLFPHTDTPSSVSGFSLPAGMPFVHSDGPCRGKGVLLRAQTDSLGLWIRFGDHRLRGAGVTLLALLSGVISKPPPLCMLLPLSFTLSSIIVFIVLFVS